MSKKKFRTDFLYPKNSPLIGAGSIFNIAGNYFDFNYSNTPEEADAKAIANDWGVVGQDLKEAMNTVGKENCSLV